MTDDLLQLMTAAIDGELTPAEAQRLRRLLDTSEEARTAFAKLKADSGRLRGLPRVAPPAELQTRIMARVAALTPPPARRVTRPDPSTPTTTPAPFDQTHSGSKVPRYRKRSWLPFALAASVLVGVAASSFLFFSQQGNTTAARTPKRPPPATRTGAEDPSWANWLPADSGPRPSVPQPRERPGLPANIVANRQPEAPSVLPPAVEPVVVAIAPDPRPARSPLVGSGFVPETQFDLVDVRVPFLKSLGDFEREDTRLQFAEELGRDPAFRIDLFARNPVRGVELFRDAAKASGLTVLADSTTLTQLQKRQTNAVVVYTEALTPAELAGLLARLTGEDAKVTPRVFGLLHAVPATAADATDLRSLLGIDPGLFKRPAADKPDKAEKSEKANDPTKPLSAGTADQIVKSVTGQSTAKVAEKTAVLLTWQPLNARTLPTASGELKQFLSKRGDRKPNAVPVLIVLRQGN